MSAVEEWAALERNKYVNLETYRKSGAGVRTPVWFAMAPGADGVSSLYVYTTAHAGKVKRIQRTDRVRVAPCDARGNVTGSWLAAHAAIVGGEEADRGMRLLNRKYWPVKPIFDVLHRVFPRHERVVIVLRLA